MQQTTEVVALVTAALTPWAAIHVPTTVLKDTQGTENIVEVRQLSLIISTVLFVHVVCPVLYLPVFEVPFV